MSVWRRRFVRFLGWWIAAFASVLAVALLLSAGYFLFFDYPETLRVRLETELTRLAGAPSTVGSISLNLREYAFELRAIQVGSTAEEGESAPPLLTVDRVLGRLRLSDIVRLRLHWTELEVQGVHLRLVDDRAPPLRLPRELPATPAFVGAGLRFSADRVSLEQAFIELSNDTVPWALEATNLSLELTQQRGSYKGVISYEDGVLTIKDHPEIRASATADIELSTGELFVHEASAVSDLGSVNARGKASLAGGANGRFDVEATGRLDRAAASLFGLTDAQRRLSGEARFQGTLDVSPDNNLLEGTIALDRGSVLGVPVRGLRGQVFWDRQLLQVSPAEAEIAAGRARFELHQPLPADEHPVSLEIDLSAVSLRALIEGTQGRPSPIDSDVSGLLSLSLPSQDLGSLDGVFQLTGAMPAEPDVEPVAFAAEGALDGGDLQIDSARVEARSLVATVSGRYPRQGDGELVADIRSDDLASLDALGWGLRGLLRAEDEPAPVPWGIAGQGRARGALRGRFPHPSFEGQLAATGLTYDRLYLDQVEARGVMSEEEIQLRDLVSRKGRGLAQGSGTLSLSGEPGSRDFDVALRLSQWPFSDLPTLLDFRADVDGSLDGEVDLRRVSGRLRGSSRVSIAEPVVLGEAFERARAEIVFDGTVVALHNAEIQREGASVRGQLDFDIASGGLNGELRAVSFPLGGSQVGRLGLGGALDLQAIVSGTVLRPAVDVTGAARELSLHGTSFPEASVTGRLVGSDFDVGVEFGDAMSLTARGETLGAVPVSGAVRFRDIDAGPWLARLSESLASAVSVVTTGEARFEASLREAQFSADADLATILVGTGELELSSLAPVRARYDNGVLHIPSVSFANDESRIELGGSVDFVQSELDLRAEGNTDLVLIGALHDSVAATGDVSLSARVSGGWAQPRLSGHADLDGAAVRVEGFPQALGDLRGRLVFDNRTIRIGELRGVFGSGPVTLAGALSLEGFRIGSIDLQAKGSEMRLRYPEGLVATLDVDLALLGRGEDQVLSGQVTLSDAVWSREYDLVAGVLSDRAGIELFDAFDGDELFQNLRFDVQIDAPDSIRLRNSIAEIDGSAELELRGSLYEPVLLGTTEAERGEVYLLGQRYDITSGKVDFVDPSRIEPFIELVAETRVRSYRVELRLTGTSSRFAPELSSDPPLRTVDILRLLSGASERDIGGTLVGNEEEELAGLGVASLLTERLTQEVGRRAERLFGLDRFSIDPFLVGRIANPTARVSLGKQITRDLSINYATNLNSTTEAIIVIEYTPEGNMSWILSRDEEGDVAIDVKFRKSF